MDEFISELARYLELLRWGAVMAIVAAVLGVVNALILIGVWSKLVEISQENRELRRELLRQMRHGS